jgi:radical SAM family uncharacterized protein/radical SAM-linked protein
MQASTQHAVHPYAEFLQAVDKPARYAGGEVGSVRKDWSAVDARVCLAFPDVYDIGMSHLGFKILYQILNDDPRTLAERAYCPWVDMERELRARGLPLVSLETYRPLRDFDVVGFSLQYELTYTNVLTMLDLGGIPLRSADRSDADPLILGGGPNATHPEPVAPFFDAFVIGDGEAKLTEVALTWKRLSDRPRRERLVALAKLGAVYVPSLYEVEREPDNGLMVVRGSDQLPFPIDRALVKLDDYPFPAEGPTGGPEAIFDRTSIEITRGCTEGCRFCQAGMIYRPVQERSPEQVIDTVRRALEKSGNDEVSLTALSTADVSYINPLIKKLAPELAKKRVSLSVSSLRAYGLAPEILDELRRVRAGGLTFAPEAGTQRMRDVVNKNVTEEQLLETAERVFSRGWQKMKLYFMIGLPTEEADDVLGIAETGKRTAAIGKKATKKKIDVTVSVSTHVPKPHTPFQWAAMDPLADIARKQQLLKDALRGVRGVKLRTHDARSSVLEGIMARGDRRLADAIEHAWRAGARFDSWDEHLRLDLWQAAFAHSGIDTDVYLRTLPVTARLPWSHIDVGLEDGFLLREYRKALQDRLSPPCGKVAGAFVHHDNLEAAERETRRLVCYDCGVACDMTEMRNDRLVHLARLGGRTSIEPTVPSDPHAGHRYRLRFEKIGPVALLGHLDLVRELPRILRRVGVSPIYSGGFHPKPQLSFSPALALGVMSLDEYVDLRLDADLDDPGLADLLRRMNRESPVGLSFVGAARLGPRDPAISRVITGARYLFAFAGDIELARDLLAAERLEVERRVKGIVRRIDLRPYLRSLVAVSGDDVLARAGLAGRMSCLEVVLAITPTGAARPAEIVQLLFGEMRPYRCVRVATFGHAMTSPLDLVSCLHHVHSNSPAPDGARAGEFSPL